MKIKTASEQIAERLRDDIFSGKYHPGSKIKEKEISESMNVSRTPIREAFRILQSDGLVEISSNRGVQVKKITVEDVEEICELRTTLEIHCIKKIIKVINEDDFQKLQGIVKQTEDALSKKDYFSYYDYSINFHVYLTSLCENTRIHYTILNARNSMRCAQIVLDKDINFLRNSNEWHKKIIQALQVKDAAGCVKLIRQHLEDNCNAMIKNLRRSDNK
jgi:DNA-binding GntR family transcriptional regulator